MALTRESSADSWAWLPSHLLDSVMDKLVPLSDYIRFSSVCKPWHSVSKHRRRRRRQLRSHRQLPMLLLPPLPGQSSSTESRRNLYSVTKSKIYQEFKIPVCYSKRISGSSLGWLFTVEENMELTLINPFSGATIHLPQIMEPPKMEDLEGDYPFEVEYEIYTAALSADPCLFPKDYAVMVIYGEMRSLAYFKSGDTNWTYINLKAPVLSDCITYKGYFYTVDNWGGVLSFDINGGSSSSDLVLGTCPSILNVVVPRTYSFFTKKTYIVESSSTGDLLLVRRFFVEDEDDVDELQLVTIYLQFGSCQHCRDIPFNPSPSWFCLLTYNL